MENNSVESLMRATMESIRDMVDVSTVLGEAIIAGDGVTIVPVSRASFGFISGGGEYVSEGEKPFAGGAGAGVSLNPVGFIVTENGSVRFINAQAKGALERLVEMFPEALSAVKSISMDKNDKNKTVKDESSEK